MQQRNASLSGIGRRMECIGDVAETLRSLILNGEFDEAHPKGTIIMMKRMPSTS